MPDVLEPHTESDRTLIPRPVPPRRLTDVVSSWLAWFGVTRMLSLGVTVVLVGAGGYWLLDAPPPPVEASLPFASTTTTRDAMPVPGGVVPSVPPVSTVSPTTTPSSVVVHIAGAVVAPGVYELPPGSRVVNAIAAADGPAPDAALDGVNQAAPVSDGQRVYVPRAGEVDLSSVDNGPVADAGPTGGDTEVASGPLDLNRATMDELDTLPGVGPSTAAAIIEDRERNGPFASVDDLDRVAGIGPAKLEALRDLVTV